jgi:hypothetical protein
MTLTNGRDCDISLGLATESIFLVCDSVVLGTDQAVDSSEVIPLLKNASTSPDSAADRPD